MGDPTSVPAVPRRFQLSFKRLLLAACDLCAGSTVLFLALRLLTGERLWWVAALHFFTPWLLLLNLIPLAASGLFGQRVRAILPGIPVAVFALLYGELFLPGLPPPSACQSACPALTVMTYNIGPANDPPSPAQIAALLRDSGADLIALQEATPDFVAPFREELGDIYPYQAQYGEDANGLMLVSRYPLEDDQYFNLHTTAFYMKATVKVNGRSILVISAHPKPPTFGFDSLDYRPGTDEDFRALADMATQGGPTLLLGDFNASSHSALVRTLKSAGLYDAFGESGWGLGSTFPARLPDMPDTPALIRIDYIWHTADFTARRARIGSDGGADHLPVLAELRLVRQE